MAIVFVPQSNTCASERHAPMVKYLTMPCDHRNLWAMASGIYFSLAFFFRYLSSFKTDWRSKASLILIHKLRIDSCWRLSSGDLYKGLNPVYSSMVSLQEGRSRGPNIDSVFICSICSC